MRFTYSNQLDSINQLARDIVSFCTENAISEKVCKSINLCLDELLTNIIYYAHPESLLSHTIDVELNIIGDRLHITVTDDGLAFNPIASSEKKPSDAPIEDRDVGGLGLYLVAQSVDYMEYHRLEDKNVLALVKKLEAE